MEYRKLDRSDERVSVLGVGTGGIHKMPDDQLERTFRKALDGGINYFDLCAGGFNVYKAFGRAIEGRRTQVYFQLHFGAVYNSEGEYGWSRELEKIKSTFESEMYALGTDYVDFGFLHCIDEDKDFEDIDRSGILEFVSELKRRGIVRHLGFSSHTPSVAQKILDAEKFDMMMFSINPAYDLERGDEYGIGTVAERTALLKRCQADGVGVSVMKPFHGGQLLSEKTSPFGKALGMAQCIAYALDRPAVKTVLAGVSTPEDLDELLRYPETSESERDYSMIAEFSPESAVGKCVYCNHCKPCPAGIDIGLINKYYDLSLAGDKLARSHYDKISVKADACIGCGHCDKRCPFGVRQSGRMKEIAKYFG